MEINDSHTPTACGTLCGRRRTWPGTLGRCSLGLLAAAATTAARGAAAAEPGDAQWKVAVGNWHSWKDPTGQQWDAVEIASVEGTESLAFLTREGRSSRAKIISGHYSSPKAQIPHLAV